RTPLALAWRLQRGGLLGWALGFAVTALVLGAAAKDIGSSLNSSPQTRDVILRMGGHAGLVDAYLAIELGLLGVVAAAFGVAAVLRMRGEETEQRAEPVLAGPVSRIRWAAAEVMLAAGGTGLLLAVAGLATGLAYGLSTGDVSGQLGRLLGAALAQVPAAWVLFGLAPRLAIPVGWTLFGVAALLTLLGPSLRLPQWALDLTPFAHVPNLPGGDFTAVPLLWLTAVAVALTGAGLAAFRRRDLT